MIHTSKQLKDKVRNISKRVSISKYRNNFILKGCAVSLEDGISFRITSVSDIMTDFEYPGIRMMLEASMERMRQVIKLDISTNDVITPSAVEYEYKLMFEDRTISLLTYNMETLLAEKMQTIIARGTANTRLRDFYDVYEIMKIHGEEVDKVLLLEAFRATCKKKGTVLLKGELLETLVQIEKNMGLAQMWVQFRKKNYFVGELEWNDVLDGVLNSIRSIL